MKLVLVCAVLAICGMYSTSASAVTISCEQGAPGSWKVCEAHPEGYSKYVWSVSGGGVLDPYVCTIDSTVCTAFCQRGSRSGFLNVSVYNQLDQLVGTASKSLGCVGGS